MPTVLEFLSPVLVLVAWTFVMWFWLYATRLPAMKKAGIDPQDAAHPGAVAHRIPSRVRSVADNYNHLHEQPTIFYALMFFAAMTGGVDGLALKLAWTYVVLRIVHSLVQATVNRVLVRFLVFSAATMVLLAFTVRELARVF
jgi:hypothetical protein